MTVSWSDPSVSWTATNVSWSGHLIGGGPSEPDPSPERLVITQPSQRLRIVGVTLQTVASGWVQ